MKSSDVGSPVGGLGLLIGGFGGRAPLLGVSVLDDSMCFLAWLLRLLLLRIGIIRGETGSCAGGNRGSQAALRGVGGAEHLVRISAHRRCDIIRRRSSRSASFFLIVSRLSNCCLPWATP